MNFHLPVIADDNELSATFDQMKSALADFREKRFAAHFTFHIAHGPADDSAVGSGFCTEQGQAPGWVKDGRAEHLHAASLALSVLTPS